jgi:hypothetical protein
MPSCTPPGTPGATGRTERVYRQLGYSSLEDFLVGFWEGFFLDERDANNLLLDTAFIDRALAELLAD